MHVPQWVKPAFWGIVVGALGIMIIGFAWWGWVLGSTAEREATERAGAAVTAVLVPICVERFMGQADVAVQLAAFQKGAVGFPGSSEKFWALSHETLSYKDLQGFSKNELW